MKNNKEKVSYCIGLETGKNLGEQFVDIDTTMLIDGIQDGLRKNTPKLPAQEISALLAMLRQQVEQQQKTFIASLAEKNKQEGMQFLQKNKQSAGVISLPSGLQYTVLQAGSGPTPTLFDTVRVHYTGSFIDGRVFDSSYKRGEPVTFPVNKVIPGWSEVLQLMKVGDRWKVYIPSYLAYGEQGFGREIGPNMTLIFEMEIVSIHT